MRKWIGSSYKIVKVSIVCTILISLILGITFWVLSGDLADSQKSTLYALAGVQATITGFLGAFLGVAYTFIISDRSEGARIFRNKSRNQIELFFKWMLCSSFMSGLLIVMYLSFLFFDQYRFSSALLGVSIGVITGLCLQLWAVFNIMNNLVRKVDRREAQDDVENRN